MQNIQDRRAEHRIFEFLLMLMVGASFIIGGINIEVSAFMGGVSIICILRGTPPSLTRANVFFISICLLYFGYFVSRAYANNLDNRTVAVFVENVPFLIAPLAIPMIAYLSPDRILTQIGNWIFPMSLILLAAVIFERNVLGVSRVFFTARSPLILTVLIVSSIHLALFEWRERTVRWRVAACASWFIGLIVIGYYTQSRASIAGHFLGASIVISYLVWDAKRSVLSNLARQTIAALGALLVFSVLVLITYQLNLVPRLNMNIDYFLNDVAQKMDYSSASRVAMWQLGLEQFWNAPMFGVGPQNTFSSIAELWPYKGSHGHLHSDFLNHLVGGGVVGVFVYLLIVLSPVFFLISNKVRDQKTIFICLFAVATIIFSGLTARVFFRPVLISWAIYLIFFCLVMTEKYNLRKSTY